MSLVFSQQGILPGSKHAKVKCGNCSPALLFYTEHKTFISWTCFGARNLSHMHTQTVCKWYDFNASPLVYHWKIVHVDVKAWRQWSGASVVAGTVAPHMVYRCCVSLWEELWSYFPNVEVHHLDTPTAWRRPASQAGGGHKAAESMKNHHWSSLLLHLPSSSKAILVQLLKLGSTVCNSP